MKKTACLLGMVFLALLGVNLYADNPDAIVGTWLDGEKKAHIEIYKQGAKYYGKIVWLSEPVYPATDRMAGKEKVDRENPDVKLRTRPVLGIVILRDFVYSGNNVWEQGRVYRPTNGKDYKCKMTLTSPDSLNVRGFVGFSLFGETQTWTRVKGATQ